MVVTATFTLVGADVAKADEVCTTTLPSDCVEDTVTGIMTPLVVPSELAVLTGTVADETTVLPAPFVVVIATVVEEPIKDESLCPVETTVTTEPSEAVELTTVFPPVVLVPADEDPPVDCCAEVCPLAVLAVDAPVV